MYEKTNSAGLPILANGLETAFAKVDPLSTQDTGKVRIGGGMRSLPDVPQDRIRRSRTERARAMPAHPAS